MSKANTPSQSLTTVSLCALLAFGVTLGLNWLRGGTLSSRLDFAVFMSVVPALPVLIAMISRRLSAKAVVLIYVVGFAALIFLQAGLR